MEEKKGLLSALAETLKQYEMNQADDKESLAIALEEKLEEIAKMISSLSDRIDNLSSRVSSIGEKVDIMSNTETGQIPEPVFDTVLDGNFDEEEEEEEEFAFDPEEVNEEEEQPEAEEAVAEEEETVEQPQEQEEEVPKEEEMPGEEVPGEEVPEEEVEEVEETEEEESEEEEEKLEDAGESVEETADEEDSETRERNEINGKKDWFDWEYDYPAEYVDDILGTMGINDKLEFVRELIHSDPALFSSQMKEIDTMPNFRAIVQYFRQAHPEWKEDSDTVYRLYMHIRRKFRN